jgi:hypothetical protein
MGKALRARYRPYEALPTRKHLGYQRVQQRQRFSSPCCMLFFRTRCAKTVTSDSTEPGWSRVEMGLHRTARLENGLSNGSELERHGFRRVTPECNAAWAELCNHRNMPPR